MNMCASVGRVLGSSWSVSRRRRKTCPDNNSPWTLRHPEIQPSLLKQREGRRGGSRPWIKDVFNFREVWFRPTAWSFQSKWQGSVRVCNMNQHAHTQIGGRGRRLINVSAQTNLHSYTSGVAYMHFITPSLIDLSLTVSPCFISIPSYRFAGCLLPWTSIGSHSI